jgi:endonuclease/exonuclease/phosphatase family metal-dependent hydrolase
MNPPKAAPSFPRLPYALLLVAVAGLLWLLAQPRPGVRERELRPALAPEPGAPAPPAFDRLRIATYNLEHYTDARGDGPERTPERLDAHARDAARIISEASPDILFLQEIENARALEALNAHLKRPYAHVYATDLRRSSGGRDKLNLAMLSRIPPRRVRQLGFHALDGAGRPARGAQSATFDLPDGSMLLLYNLHLKSNYGEAPRNQAQRAIALHHVGADAVSQTYRHHPRPTATLVLGDTNVDPDSEAFADDPSLEPLAGAFVDLWRGRPLDERTTIPTRLSADTNMIFPPAAFDRVFASKNLVGPGPWRVAPPKVLQKGTVTRDNEVKPGTEGHVSDHYLVYVDLQLAAPPPPPSAAP